MTELIRRHRQALLVLVYLRKGETFAELAAGFGVSVTTGWCYVEETVKLLSARSPKPDQPLRKLRCSPNKVGHLAKALHVLQNREAQGG